MRFINLASFNSQFLGLEYYEEKKVLEYKKIDENIFQSKVKGSNNIYNVIIDVNHPRRSLCDCPFANGRRVICKHMIATYFKAFPKKVKEFNDDVERCNREYEEEQIRKRNLAEKEIKEYVNSLSAKEVRKKLIEYLMDEYDEENNRRDYW